jgi:hypothetical protein
MCEEKDDVSSPSHRSEVRAALAVPFLDTPFRYGERADSAAGTRPSLVLFHSP